MEARPGHRRQRRREQPAHRRDARRQQRRHTTHRLPCAAPPPSGGADRHRAARHPPPRPAAGTPGRGGRDEATSSRTPSAIATLGGHEQCQREQAFAGRGARRAGAVTSEGMPNSSGLRRVCPGLVRQPGRHRLPAARGRRLPRRPRCSSALLPLRSISARRTRAWRRRYGERRRGVRGWAPASRAFTHTCRRMAPMAGSGKNQGNPPSPAAHRAGRPPAPGFTTARRLHAAGADVLGRGGKADRHKIHMPALQRRRPGPGPSPSEGHRGHADRLHRVQHRPHHMRRAPGPVAPATDAPRRAADLLHQLLPGCSRACRARRQSDRGDAARPARSPGRSPRSRSARRPSFTLCSCGFSAP